MALTAFTTASWSVVAAGAFSGEITAGDPSVLHDGSIWRLFYTDGIHQADGTNTVIAQAISTDGLTWTQIGGNMTSGIVVAGSGGDTANLEAATIFKAGDSYVLLYSAYADTDGALSGFPAALHAAVSTDGVNFTAVAGGPVLAPTQGGYDNDAVYSPTVIAVSGGYLMLYCGHAYTDASAVGGAVGVRLLAATSTDGITWTKHDEPVLTADPALSWMSDGVAEPSLIQGPDGKWYLFFTGLHGDERVIGIAVATDPLGPWEVAPAPIVTAATLGLPSGGGVIAPEAELTDGVLRLWFGAVSPDGQQSIAYAEADWGGGTRAPLGFVPHWLGTDLNDIIQGSAGNNSITGGNGDDRLTANGGNDTIVAGNGHDTIIAGDGNDRLLGGAGDDVIDAGDGADTVLAGIDADLVWGGAGNDSLLGEAGDDHLHGGTGRNTLVGGAGADVLSGDLDADVLRGDTGDDVLIGGDGTDNLAGGDGLDVLDGGVGNDTLDGGAGDDQLAGGVGDDLLSAGAGDDIIDAGAGNDTVDGGADNDVIWGGDGRDSLFGGTGNDILYGGAGASTLDGGDGADVLIGDINADVLLGGIGADFIVGGAGADRLDGGADADNLQGEDGDDTIAGGAGADVLVGGAGTDWADYSRSTGVTVSLDGSVTGTGDAAGDVMGGIENLIGSATGSDLLVGDGGANRLEGRIGNDTLIGGGGADILLGGAGNDLYSVDSSADLVIEGASAGTDTVRTSVSFTLSANVETIAVASGTIAGLTLTGNSLDNLLTGGVGPDVLNGGAGADTMAGGAGNDSYVIDSAADVVTEAANAGIDTVRTGVSFTLGANVETLVAIAGASVALALTGNALNNTLTGGSGADTLNGGAGNDSLLGGAGNDAFVFNTTLNATTNLDRISGFSTVDDTIVLENAVMAGLGAATGGLSTAAFRSGVGVTMAGDADDRIIYNLATGDLYYDADGSGGVASIRFAVIENKAALTAADFLIV